jgi:hypothetical protein
MTYVHVEGVMLGMLGWVARLNRLGWGARLDRLDWVARLPPIPRYFLSQPSSLPFYPTYTYLVPIYLHYNFIFENKI